MENAQMFSVLFGARESNHFKARSPGRDAEIDLGRAASILRSIEHALEETKAEHAGLRSRIDDAIARAAVTAGNDADEYLTREPEDNHLLNLLGAEIANGQRRLNELEIAIVHFDFLKTALVTRFPDLKLAPTVGASVDRA
jgi:hypothetical protein